MCRDEAYNPMNCCDEDVRAMLAGRRTQARRPVRFEPPADHIRVNDDDAWDAYWEGKGWRSIKTPFGIRGDKLWVRECWRPLHVLSGHELYFDFPGQFLNWGFAEVIEYRTSQGSLEALRQIWGNPQGMRQIFNNARLWDPVDNSGECPWKSASHMPEWASRIILDVQRVSIEPLQEITNLDAIAEGCSEQDPIKEFALKWNRRYGKSKFAWEHNPCVWACTFDIAEVRQ